MNSFLKYSAALVLLIAFGLTHLYSSDTASISPDSALKKLQQGNVRFKTGKRVYPDLTKDRRVSTARNGQTPYAVILSCSDSRVPLEHIFDAGIGDLFAIRIAGNVATQPEIGSAEYGIGHLGAPLLLVLGHSSCGAVTAVAKGTEAKGNLAPIIKSIEPSVRKANLIYGDVFSQQLLDEAIKINVYQAMEDILRRSSEIGELVKNNRVKVVGGIYHLETGEVEWLGEHPMQEKFIEEGEHTSKDTNNTAPVKPKAKAAKKAKPVKPKQKQIYSLQFLFPNDSSLGASPRNPQYVTLLLRTPRSAQNATVQIFAENVHSGKRESLFMLPRVKITDGRAQTQFYWSARKFRQQTYVPKGEYKLSANVDFWDAADSFMTNVSKSPEPSERYILTVK